MNSDLIAMLGNLSQSFFSIQHIVSGLAYLLGVLFFMKAIQKFHKIGDKKSHSPSQEKMFVPAAYLLAGTALVFLPSMLGVLSNTVFGAGNVLQYATYTPYSVYGAMGIIIRTAGVIWFIRGCVLLAHASEPGVQEGPKGVMFLIAGIFSMNFDSTVAYLNWAVAQLLSYTLTAPATTGA
ncbi:MAG: type IV secretion protein IcmC [Legionella sp.]|nr:type IV secretion protein IcmC [Legionella sp.]